VQIKKEEVDHVPVKEAICQVSKNARKQKRQGYISPRVTPPGSHQQDRHDSQSDEGNHNEESVIALEGSKRGTGIRHVNQMEEVRYYISNVEGVNGSHYPLLRQLVQSV